MRRLCIFALLFLIISSCRNRNRGLSSNLIFFDYKIRGEEKDSNVTAYIQYKVGGPNGPTLRLHDPADVEIDGRKLETDSARVTGPYYEVRSAAHTFPGKHRITFNDFHGNSYTEEFEYHPFVLRTKIPAVLSRQDIVLTFGGLNPRDVIRVSATDTSFASRDINEIDTVINGKLVIPSAKLKHLTDGPIILLLSRETESPVKHSGTAGGRIVISYGMQREFELRSETPK